MIVVTGTARSGTSLVMQTLEKLGIGITGEKFDKYNVEEYNKKGYWELPVSATIDGIQDNRYEGKGVKLFVQQLTRTNPKLISRAIRCCRYRGEASKSYQKLLAHSPECGVPATRKVCDELFDVGREYTKRYLDENKIPYIDVDYNDMMRDPKGEIERITKFLKVKTDIKQAVENVGI